MSLKKRFLILAAVFSAFLIIAAGVIVFSLGYTFDFSTRKFVSTGTLLAYSDPKGGEIFLNGRSTGKTTPATIRLLPPGEYDVEIRKPGYRIWKKHFTLLPKQVLWNSPPNGSAALFLESPIPILASESAFDILALNNEIWLINTEPALQLQKLDTRQTRNLKIPPLASGQRLHITSDGNWAALSGNSDVLAVYNFAAGEKIDLAEFGIKFSSVESFGQSDLILLSSMSQLYQYSLETKILSLRRQTCASFAVQDDSLYFVDGNSVYHTNRASTTAELVASKLPLGERKSLFPAAKNGLFALIDRKLYRLDPQPRILAENLDSVSWDTRSEALIFYDSHAIWVFSPATDIAPQLVVRSSEKLELSVINPPAGQIFYLENGKLKAAEIYASGSRNITDFPELGVGLKKILVNAEGTILYTLTQDEKVYQTQIR